MALQGAVAEAVREGKEIQVGETLITASVVVDTPFADIDAVLITHRTSDAPGVGSLHFTYDIVGNVVTLYAWKATGTADVTLVAGTVETTVDYIILGRRR